MARGRVIGRVVVAAPVPAVLMAVVTALLHRLPASSDGTGVLASRVDGPTFLILLLGSWVLGAVVLAWAGFVSARDDGLSLGPTLVAALVLFMAALASMMFAGTSSVP